ncbi:MULTISPECIES: hypothetical protein [unclassified Acidovorax]|uniref:hypothetical protein n=1 Tax=unclassified Acidovorax TaxID=2684926 RepID=UPI0028831603|nr:MULTISPECIES: hypothetical protein [unclassified Acidovorax]
MARSASVGVTLALIAIAGGGGISAWWWLGAPVGVVPVAACAGIWLLTTALAARAWLQSPSGTVEWDGAQWWLTVAPTATPIAIQQPPSVLLDFQSFLLISLQPQEGCPVWLGLEMRQAPLQWATFRRAVYSRAHTPGNPATPGSADGTPSS